MEGSKRFICLGNPYLGIEAWCMASKKNGGKKGGPQYEKLVGNIMGKKGDSYKCHICGKETKSSVDAMTHLIDHVTSALEGVNNLIKEQKTGKVDKRK